MRFLLACLALWPLFAFAIQPTRIAPGVYAFIGDAGEVTPANSGFAGNAGFIIGTDGIIVIDTGISYRFAQEMLTAIQQISHQPIRLVILTHATQEFIFGAAFFQERGIPILAHRRTADLMRARCENCLNNLRQVMGREHMENSAVVKPDRQIDHSVKLSIAGRPIELLHFGWGSTVGDLVVFDCTSGVAFAGGLVSNGRIPDLRDGDFGGWLEALGALEKLSATVVVPGFGPPGPATRISDTRDYLRALDNAVRSQYHDGVSLLNVSSQTPLPAFASWKQYSALHPKNVEQRYLEVEREEFN